MEKFEGNRQKLNYPELEGKKQIKNVELLVLARQNERSYHDHYPKEKSLPIGASREKKGGGGSIKGGPRHH